MNKIFLTGLAAAAILSACSENDFDIPGQAAADNGLISLTGEITQEAVSRANDNGFADGDVMGVYIVDYEGNAPGTLKSSGNRGDNVRHTFDEANYRWNSAYDVYWKDKHTSIDVYGYYPFGSPDDVSSYRFTVRTNQARTYSDGTMGDYEASDFLWGKVTGVAPTTNVIRLPMTHRMANARITLVEGSGFAEGEWTQLDKQVLVANTVQDAVVDLATGTVTPDGEVGSVSITPSKRGDEWRAIVVPQTVRAGTTMFNIGLGGIPYKFVKNEDFEYVAGKMSNFAIRVDKKEVTGDFTLTLICESITPWENDLVSHDAATREYVVVNVTEPGKLKEAIAATGKDFKQLKNLKITGQINANDFYFMKDEMDDLKALNLKEVKIKAAEYMYSNDDEIPGSAMRGKTSLTFLVLPDKLRYIGEYSFAECTNLTGSLIIPEGVTEIRHSAFNACRSLTGTLSLPSTLRKIGNSVDQNGNQIKEDANFFYTDQGTFNSCNFSCELNIPESVEYIGSCSFYNCTGLHGNLHLPQNLKILGSGAFSGCSNLTGSLEIPQSITKIYSYTFSSAGFDGNLTLHDGITYIGQQAFAFCGFKGELVLPKDLTIIDGASFSDCRFSGEIVFPKKLVSVGDQAFYNNSRLSGTLEFPEGLQSIGGGAFGYCQNIERIVFPKSLESIRSNRFGGAFINCFGVSAIVCKSETPPYIPINTFDGVPKDNFTLEVPEASVAQYQTAQGWCDFKRIAAHHELVCRPAVACALSTEHKQTLIINAEGDWEVESLPGWCELSQTEGSKKSEITLTIKSSSDAAQREGDVVFRLKDKDYTHRCHVTQCGYQYAEDEYLTLQTATKGNNGGIDIVILGDGYNAREIADGSYLADMRQASEDFFAIEPYTTYRDYFNVYTAFPLSTESGVGTVNTIRYNKFGTTFTNGTGLKCDYDMVFDYAMKAPTVNAGNIDRTLIIIVPNSTDYGGVTQMWTSGAAIALCPKSSYRYPFDSRGVIQHEAGGHGFGKLGDEYIYFNSFIDGTQDELALRNAKKLGWCDNLELTGKMHEVGWSHLIFDTRYSDIVDIFEGGYKYSRGVFRSEQNSCMNNNIPYFSTISRESIVKRIKRYAGEQFDFEEFAALDKRTASVRSRSAGTGQANSGMYSNPPVIHRGSPLKREIRRLGN